MYNRVLEFIFPNSCLQCQKLLSRQETIFCHFCQFHLPYTYWKWGTKNAMIYKLESFVPIEHASSIFYFRKGNSIQKLLHALKYQNRTEVSIWLTKQFLLNSYFPQNHDVDCIIPVPIHAKKKKERGYNQNTSFGENLATFLHTDYQETVLRRTRHQKSQTLLHKGERMARLENTFEINELPSQYQHYLLIDDVCTTGSTLLHCAGLLKRENKKVSILTMAFAI